MSYVAAMQAAAFDDAQSTLKTYGPKPGENPC